MWQTNQTSHDRYTVIVIWAFQIDPLLFRATTQQRNSIFATSEHVNTFDFFVDFELGDIDLNIKSTRES
jgi:hypothetical protein